MPTNLGDLRIEASRENLRIIAYFIQGIGQRLGLSDNMMFDVELAVEEAATNIITHAYQSDATGIIEMHAEFAGEALEITLKDWGRPFDINQVKPFDIHAPIESRIHGGMGLHFIRNMMDKAEHHAATEAGQPNSLRLVKFIERATGSKISKRQSQELMALQTVSEVMTTNIELNELLAIIINKLVETIGAERGTLYLVDQERGELWSKVLLEEASVLPEIRVKVGQGIAGYVALTGEVLNIADAHTHPMFNADFDTKTGYITRNILAVPMRNPQQQIIGVVQLLNKTTGDSFTTPDARLLTAMASQAAISIENARLYRQELDQKVIERELKTARDIQVSFLPEEPPQLEGWDIAVFWKPVNSVAGDFYDFYTLNDGRLAVVIADVSGKGIPAALFMAVTVTVLRFGMSLGLPPKEMIERANHLVLEHQRSRMFATIFVGYTDLSSGEIEFVNAGHNPPILYRAATGECELLRAPGVALGIFAAALYEEKTVQMKSGDVLVLFTDGLTEAYNPAEEEFGEERLEAIICENAAYSASTIKAHIISAVHEFAVGCEDFDDETLIVIKRV